MRHQEARIGKLGGLQRFPGAVEVELTGDEETDVERDAGVLDEAVGEHGSTRRLAGIVANEDA